MAAQERKIQFSWQGVDYQVGMEASQLNLIVLPNGTLLQVYGWYESLPPQPMRLQPVNHLYSALKPSQIAGLMNAALAESLSS